MYSIFLFISKTKQNVSWVTEWFDGLLQMRLSWSFFLWAWAFPLKHTGNFWTESQLMCNFRRPNKRHAHCSAACQERKWMGQNHAHTHTHVFWCILNNGTIWHGNTWLWLMPASFQNYLLLRCRIIHVSWWLKATKNRKYPGCLYFCNLPRYKWHHSYSTVHSRHEPGAYDTYSDREPTSEYSKALKSQSRLHVSVHVWRKAAWAFISIPKRFHVPNCIFKTLAMNQ